MSVGNLSQRERLAAELKTIRREARITQAALSVISGVGTTRIKDIERAGPLPKPETLRLLANGAATDGAGSRDDAKAQGYYDRMARAAGYVATEQVGEPELAEDTLKRQIEEAFGDDARQLEDFFVQAASFDREDRLFIVQTVAWLKTLIPQGRGVRQRHAMFPS